MASDTQLTPYGPLSTSLNGRRLGDLCLADGVQTGPFGSQLHQEDYVTEGTPIITVEHLGDNRIAHQGLPCVSDEDRQRLAKYSLRTGDIVFSRVGSVDRRAIVHEAENGWLFSGRCLRVRPDPEKLDSQWLSYFFGLPAFKRYIRGIAVGATMPSINTKILSDVPIYFPTLVQQRNAAKFLTSLDDKIDVNRRINQTLEAMAQAIFKSWFVDFDPVKAKISAIQEGRNPQRAAMSAISGKPDAELDALPPEQYEQLAVTAALFPDAMEESELGEIPKGWSVARIQDVVEGVYDGPHATPPEAKEGAVFLGIRNMTGTSLDMSDIRHIAETDWEQWTRRVEPRAGDIVFSYEATLGYFALLPSGLRCCLGRRLALIRPLAERGFGSFWFHQFVAPPFQRFLEKHTIPGATVNRIALKDFPSFPVLKPATAVQSSFCERVDTIWSLVHSNQTQSARLAKLRDTLLPRLLSGELSVEVPAESTGAA